MVGIRVISMEREEIVEKFCAFLNDYYKEELLLAVSEGKKSITIDFLELDRTYPDLANMLLEKPEEVLKAMEEAIKQIDTALVDTALRVRFFNLPDDRNIRIRNIRAEHIGKMIVVDGIVKRASEIRPEVSEAVFECPVCGNRISVIQTEKLLTGPIRCECGNKKGFKIVEQKLYDARWIVVEEPFEITTGERPSELMIYLKEDLTSPKMQNKTDPGNRIKIVGILKQLPRRVKGTRSRQIEIYLDANSVESVEVEWEELEISPEDEKRIIELSKDPEIFKKLVNSLAPTIYGMDEVKEAIILQMFGGEPHLLKDGTRIRGEIHILLVGDPASGKCVHGDTKVVLSDGRIKKIREIVEDGMDDPIEIDDGYFALTNHKVLSLLPNGKLDRKVATILWKRKAPKFMYKVETETGVKIITTPSHLFLTMEDGCITYKRARDLSPNSFIGTLRFLPINGSKQEINVKIRERKERKKIKFPKLITPEFCRFIGYIIGGGYIQKRGASGRICFTSNDHEILEDFKRCVKKVFGDVHISEVRPQKGKGTKELIISSISIVEFLERLEPTLLKGSRKKRIPEIVLKSENKNVKELLKALFEGKVSIRKDARSMELTLASNELIDQIRVLLLRFGILSQTHPRMARASNSQMSRRFYRIRISGINFENFLKKIGFVSERRKSRAIKVLSANKHTDIDTIPSLSKFLKILRKTLRLTQLDMGIPRSTYQHFEKGGRNLTRRELRKIIKALKKRVDEIKIVIRKLDEIKPKELASVRNKINISQAKLASLTGISQTLISRYELGKIKLVTEKSERTFKKIKEALKKICVNMISHSLEIDKLDLLLNSDIFWDRVIKVNKIRAREKWVYDLQVDGTHNFIANNVIVHNSQLMQLASRLIPRGKYVSGRGVTAAGLTASVVRDEEFLGGWVLEAGALVMANRSICAIDEFSKVSTQDQVALQEAMSLGTISIAKASIVATLPAQTAILAGGNPKLGRFDPYIPIREQVDISDVLLSRFDLKFALRDIPNPELDARMADHILKMRHFEAETVKPIIEPAFLRKYIAYARANVHPKLSKEAGEKLKEFYLQMREKSGEEAPIAITLRQYEALIRLAEASAKVRLSQTVEVEDALRAIRLMKFSLRQFGFEPETGKIDIDRAEGQRVTAAQRSKIRIMLDIIDEMSLAYGKEIPRDEVIEKAKEQGVKNPDEILTKMQREGIIYAPAPGKISKVRA